MDGEESPSEREARLQSLWKRLNVRNRDSLDLPALKAGLRNIDHPLKDADDLIRDMLVACDINHDGQISYEEFVRFCEETEGQLRKLFDGIDRDRSGQLDKNELSTAFERAGMNLSEERLERFFSYIDRNHDGGIDFREWRDFLLFIPTSAPGMKAVFNYYASSVKLNSEGDVSVGDHALGLGMTTLDSLKHVLFGAIIQLVHPIRTSPHVRIAPSTDDYDDHRLAGIDYNPEMKTFDAHPSAAALSEDDDPYLPLKPARRKDEEHQTRTLRLTDFVPDVGYFIAGGLSGITSRTATAPLDRLKVYLIAQTGNAKEAIEAAKSGAAIQATKHGTRTLAKACQDLWAAGGVRSLFAGNGINVVKVMPESAVKFGSYEACKRAVASLEGHSDPAAISQPSQFIAGGLAGMISQAVVYPLDTLKFRMQCEVVPGGETGSKLLFHTAQKMWARNGVVSFYRGLPMGLVGMFPYAAIDLFTFETLKRRVVKRNMKKYKLSDEEDALPGNFSMALMGGFSGAIGASIVYPLNLLRTRLQSQGTPAHPRTYTGIVDVCRQTVKGEGARGLFKGLTPNLLKVVPAVSITYVVYENCKKAMHLH